MIPELLLVLAAASPLAADASLPRGQVVENLHGEDAEQTYALYLPTSYDAARPAPIVYLLDARGRALVPLERFRAGGESLGVVLASSYRSRSDEAVDPNGPAVRAMWMDTHDRLQLDDRRVFLAGFSGTARVACLLAAGTKDLVKGVIASGAGFPSALAPSPSLTFLYFAGVGDEDFNHDEVLALDRTLFDLGYPYRYEVYPGPHDWMPEATATRALEWMLLRTTPAEERPAGFVDGLFSRDRERAAAFESAGRRQDAYRAWSFMARDYAGLRDTAEAAERARTLAASEPRKAEEKARRKAAERDQAVLGRAQQVIAQSREDPDDPFALSRVLSELQVPSLKKRAAGQGEDALSARRMIASLQAQLAFYLPRAASERGAHGEAVLFLTIASEIEPQEPGIWYRLAAAQARAGRSKKALTSLGRAVDAGFRDRARLEAEGDFASLKREAGYQQLLARLP